MGKILIIDNNLAQDRLVLRELLESNGYQVIEVADVTQALAEAWDDQPDLVLIDSHGSEAVEALRSHYATAMLPVLLLDGNNPDQMETAYEFDSGVEYVPRPVNDHELLARIRSALRTSQVQAELRRRNEQLVALVSVMDAANSTLDLRELARRVLERALVVTSMMSGSIWLRDHDEIVCLARYPPDPQHPDRWAPQPIRPDTPLGRVMTTGQPEFVAALAEASGASPHPAAILPLTARDDLIGAFVFVAATPEPAQPEERAVLIAIATHVAVAIQHAQLYQRAERQRQQLQAIDRQKDEFISITSHELKNPMASIKGYADLMLRRMAKKPNDPNRKGLEIISQQVNRMTSLLDQLLDVSRIGMDRLQIERRPLDLVAITQRIVEEMRGTTELHQLKLEVRDAPLTGDFDEARISQVISNLLSNAIKYSPNGGTITVRIGRVPTGAGREALISVEDHGIGIPAEDRKRLFERFFRASNAGASFAGMGLGLFITRGIVVRHGGRIWVESEERHGTTFYIALPIA
jgi:signal transduction histidine kinase